MANQYSNGGAFFVKKQQDAVSETAAESYRARAKRAVAKARGQGALPNANPDQDEPKTVETLGSEGAELSGTNRSGSLEKFG